LLLLLLIIILTAKLNVLFLGSGRFTRIQVKRTSAKLGFIKWNESMNLGNQLIRPQIDQIGTGEESQLGMFHIRHLVLWYTLVIDPKLLPPQFCCTAQFFSDHLNISLLTGDFHHNFASSLKYAMK